MEVFMWLYSPWSFVYVCCLRCCSILNVANFPDFLFNCAALTKPSREQTAREVFLAQTQYLELTVEYFYTFWVLFSVWQISTTCQQVAAWTVELQHNLTPETAWTAIVIYQICSIQQRSTNKLHNQDSHQCCVVKTNTPQSKCSSVSLSQRQAQTHTPTQTEGKKMEHRAEICLANEFYAN